MSGAFSFGSGLGDGWDLYSGGIPGNTTALTPGDPMAALNAGMDASGNSVSMQPSMWQNLVKGLPDVSKTLQTGVSGGLAQLPQQPRQGLPSSAGVHQGQGSNLDTLLQLLQQRRTQLMSLGARPGGAGGGGLLGM